MGRYVCVCATGALGERGTGCEGEQRHGEEARRTASGVFLRAFGSILGGHSFLLLYNVAYGHCKPRAVAEVYVKKDGGHLGE